MALVIEDGSIVSGANSYITVAEYSTWADARFGASR
ncbi:MAG: DnaT-like ssDNA-binding protein, partial [Rickettsiales bacterium]